MKPEIARHAPVVKVLISGRLEDDVKGVSLATHIIRRLSERSLERHPSPSVQLLACGTDPVSEERILSTLRIEPGEGVKMERSLISVFPQMSHDQLQSLMHLASIVVLPSSAESFGLGALEALALGRPTLGEQLFWNCDHVCQARVWRLGVACK